MIELARDLAADRPAPSGAVIGRQIASDGGGGARATAVDAAASPVRLSQAGANTSSAVAAATGRQLAGIAPRPAGPRPVTGARIAQKIASGRVLSLAARL